MRALPGQNLYFPKLDERAMMDKDHTAQPSVEAGIVFSYTYL